MKLSRKEQKALGLPVAPVKRQQAPEQARELFLAMCKAHKLPEPVPEYKFHPTRKWRFDWAWPGEDQQEGETWAPESVALEVEGGVFMKDGGHRGMGRFLRDIEKYNEAAIMGWTVIRVTTDHVKSGEAFALVRRALGL